MAKKKTKAKTAGTVARFWQKDRPQGDLFWELTVTGKTVSMRGGNFGAVGKSTEKMLADANAAKTFADKAIHDHEQKGFVEQTGDAIWIAGKGKKPMLLRVPVDTDELAIPGYNLAQESLDLTEVGKLTKLREIYISGHKLKSLDHSGLASCKKLRELTLHENGLTTIDLSPLAAIRSLEELCVGHMKGPVDLTPLAKCGSLETLNLQSNSFATVDLSPLAKTPRLKELYLAMCDKLKKIDVTPLAAHKTLRLITVDQGCTILGESSCRAKVQYCD